MKTTINKTTEIEITHVHLVLPVNYEQEEVPNDFPMRVKDVWRATIEIDTGVICDWPKDHRACRLNLTVKDEGIYRLIALGGNVVAELDGYYVPHGLIPGDFGDVVIFLIDRDGKIANWPAKPNVSEFFKTSAEA